MLVDKTEYLSAGIHIGMKACTLQMKQFVYKTREDGLSVFNLQEIDNRISGAINILSKYKKILVISNKNISAIAITKFAEMVGGKAIAGRLSPGTLTNPSYREFYEPDVVIVVDPETDAQGIEEAKKRRVPVIGLCGTSNNPNDLDFIIPINNNGRKSLALLFWILSRGLLKSWGKIKNDDEFKATLKDFGDVGKPKREGGAGELDLGGGNFDIDIDIEIEDKDKKEKPGKQTRDKKKGPKTDRRPKV